MNEKELTHQDLDYRVRRLERHLKAERIVWVVLVIGLSSVVVLKGQSVKVPATVEAEEFILRDSRGRVHASLSVEGEGSDFSLYDQNRKNRLSLVVAPDGVPSVWLMDDREVGRAELSLASGIFPYLEFYDHKSAGPKLSMSLSNDGEGHLFIYDKKKGEYWSAPRAGEGEGPKLNSR
jgi:hypothetical protein